MAACSDLSSSVLRRIVPFLQHSNFIKAASHSMQDTGSYYDLSSYDAEDERMNDPQGPPVVNLYAAATYVGGLLESNNLRYAVMGGFAMVCRGSSRTTVDVDIATNATMKQLWKVVEPEPGKVLSRFIIPNTKLLDKIIRMFVRTGPTYGDTFCAADKLVEVDVKVFGSRSSSANLEDHIETLQVSFGDYISSINVLDVYYMMRTKLRTLTTRAAGRDFDDIDFLLANNASEVTSISQGLDLADRVSFVETDQIQSRGPSVIRRYQKLLHL